MMDAVFDALYEALLWFIQLVTQPFQTLMEALMEAFPEYGSELSAINEYLFFMDHWVNINACIQMSVAFLGFWTVLTIYKVVKSWIPTVSGSG